MVYILFDFIYTKIRDNINKTLGGPAMAKIQTISKSTTTHMTIKKKRSYQDTLNNLAQYLEQTKKK